MMFFSFLSAVGMQMLFWALHIETAHSFPKPLSAKEEAEAILKMQQGDEKAKNLLIEHNLRLVAHIIKKYYAGSNEQDDLISIGTIGLIKAVNTFHGDKGTRLTTYAARCIENEILMYFRQKKKSAQDISMNEPIDSDAEGNPLMLSQIVFTEDTAAEDLDLKIKLQKLHQYLDEMPSGREKTILLERYGLLDDIPKTQHEIAEKLGISRSYVSRIEKKGLRKLKQRFLEEETDHIPKSK